MICIDGVSVQSSRRREGTYVEIERRRNVNLVDSGVKVGVTPQVTPDDELGEHLVDDGVGSIFDDAEDVESGKDGLGELDVLTEGDRGVVASSDGIGGGDDGATSLKGRDDTSLGDGDGLLLHRLVNRRSVHPSQFHELVDEDAGRDSPIRVVHLVKLVDHTHSLVG